LKFPPQVSCYLGQLFALLPHPTAFERFVTFSPNFYQSTDLKVFYNFSIDGQAIGRIPKSPFQEKIDLLARHLSSTFMQISSQTLVQIETESKDFS
jgi:hypothetical protein